MGKGVTLALDTSDVLVALFRDPGIEVVPDGMQDARIRSVNHAEATTSLIDMPDADAAGLLETFDLSVESFDTAQAIAAEFPRRPTRSAGRSPDDRAALARAQALDVSVLSADIIRTDLNIGVAIEGIR